MRLKNKLIKYLDSFLAGILGMLGLVMTYVFSMLLATRDFGQVLGQFILFKYWIVALVLGFGVQMGLFWYIRSKAHLSGHSPRTAVVASTGTSTMAMVACCAHHLTDLLPILGLSAATLLLSKYQAFFFTLGIVANITGIVWMVYVIKNKKIS